MINQTCTFTPPVISLEIVEFFTKAPSVTFRDVSLSFKKNVKRLRVRKERVMLKMTSQTTPGMVLERGDWDILTKHKATIDHHMTTTGTNTEDVCVWVALKDRRNAIAYVSVKPFWGSLYVDIRLLAP